MKTNLNQHKTDSTVKAIRNPKTQKLTSTKTESKSTNQIIITDRESDQMRENAPFWR